MPSAWVCDRGVSPQLRKSLDDLRSASPHSFLGTPLVLLRLFAERDGEAPATRAPTPGPSSGAWAPTEAPSPEMR